MRYYSYLSTFSFSYYDDDDVINEEDDNDICDHIYDASFVYIQIVVFFSGSSFYCYVGSVYVCMTQFFTQHTLSQQSLMVDPYYCNSINQCNVDDDDVDDDGFVEKMGPT